jgi:hypothetical protein
VSSPIDVIGAGWGRTGTESLKAALEILGFGRCYHMFELLKTPRQVVHFEKLARGERPDYDDLFRGYRSAVDFPAAFYYRELLAEYPDAKVILTVRDPDAWYASASKTILRDFPTFALALAKFLGVFSPRLRMLPRLADYVRGSLFEGLLEGNAKDATWTKARFVAWNEEVVRTVPAEKLLVYQVQSGWGPLCAFLGVPTPDVPFPRSNDSASFEQRTRPSALIRGLWKERRGSSTAETSRERPR